MPEFFNSLLLVAVAQIPLLLKLWLDHKNAVSGFKQELYKRQLEGCQKLSACLTVVLENSQIIIKFIGEKSLPKDKGDQDTDDKDDQDLDKVYHKNIKELMESIKTVELLLPAELCEYLSKYVTCSTQLWAKGFFPMIINQNKSPVEIWKEQEELFNVIINYMRLICGTDMLSNSTFKQIFNSSGKKTSLIRRNLNI